MTQKWIVMVGIIMLSTQAFAAEAPTLKTEMEQTSYAVGVEVARNFKKQGIAFDENLFIRGLKDEIAGKKLLFSDTELRSLMNNLQNEVRRRMAAERKQAAMTNRQKEVAFLAENQKKPGVTVLPDGLQYSVIKEGTGPKATLNEWVVCSYRGTFPDGTEFEATPPGEPATLQLSRLIPGWREALALMPVGSHWKVVIPSQLGYGEKGMGADIGPNQTLIFDVELLSIKSNTMTPAAKTH